MKINELKLITENHNIDNYIIFYQNIVNKMKNPEWLGIMSREDIEYIISNGGKLYIYCLDNEIVCSMLYIPCSKKQLEKFNLNLNYQEVGDCGPIMVSEKFRGNDLQKEMLRQLEKDMLKLNIKYIITTIHPENKISIKNFEIINYKYNKTLNLKRGLRNLYIKEIK